MKIAKEKMCRLRFMLWQISNVANELKISYIKKRSGNITLRFAKQLPDRNFLFYIFNFQFVKLSLFCE